MNQRCRFLKSQIYHITLYSKKYTNSEIISNTFFSKNLKAHILQEDIRFEKPY